MVYSKAKRSQIGQYFESSEYARRVKLIWALMMATEDLTFLLADDMTQAFRAMFPDSSISKSFSLERTQTRDLTILEIASFIESSSTKTKKK